MFVKLTISIVIFILNLNVYGQNPDGEAYFTLVDGGKEIIFTENEADTSYCSKTGKYKLEIELCWKGSCSNASTENTYFIIPIPGSGLKISKESSIINIDYMYTPTMKIIITKKRKKEEKMTLNYTNIGQTSFASIVKFRPGEYIADVKKLMCKTKYNKKKWYFPTIRQRLFKRIKH